MAKKHESILVDRELAYMVHPGKTVSVVRLRSNIKKRIFVNNKAITTLVRGAPVYADQFSTAAPASTSSAIAGRILGE